MRWWAWLLLGLFIGTFLGVFITSLCVAASKN
jgi:hypothetical protein